MDFFVFKHEIPFYKLFSLFSIYLLNSWPGSWMWWGMRRTARSLRRVQPTEDWWFSTDQRAINCTRSAETPAQVFLHTPAAYSVWAGLRTVCSCSLCPVTRRPSCGTWNTRCCWSKSPFTFWNLRIKSLFLIRVSHPVYYLKLERKEIYFYNVFIK